MTARPDGDVGTCAPHPSVFIIEEMEARGWSSLDLARRMGGEIGVNRLAADMYLLVGPGERNMRIGQHTADQFGRAFDVSPEYFLNLERAWLASPARASIGDEG